MIARSPLQPTHERKNCLVGVFKLELRAITPAELDPADVRFEAFSPAVPVASNKTASAVQAVHKPTGLTVVA